MAGGPLTGRQHHRAGDLVEPGPGAVGRGPAVELGLRLGAALEHPAVRPGAEPVVGVQAEGLLGPPGESPPGAERLHHGPGRGEGPLPPQGGRRHGVVLHPGRRHGEDDRLHQDQGSEGARPKQFGHHQGSGPGGVPQAHRTRRPAGGHHLEQVPPQVPPVVGRGRRRGVPVAALVGGHHRVRRQQAGHRPPELLAEPGGMHRQHRRAASLPARHCDGTGWGDDGEARPMGRGAIANDPRPQGSG